MGATYGGGRRPNPEYLRVVDKRHAHEHKNDPKPILDKPIAPDHLTDREKWIFYDFVKRVEEIGIASATDTAIITMYAKNHAEMEYLEAFLKENGHTYTTMGISGEQHKAHPQAAMYDRCKALEFKLLVEFGLSPVSRARVKIAPKKKEVNVNPFAALDSVEEG